MVEAVFYSYHLVATADELLTIIFNMYLEDVAIPEALTGSRDDWIDRQRRPIMFFLERWLLWAYTPDFAEHPEPDYTDISYSASTQVKPGAVRRFKQTPCFSRLLDFISTHMSPQHQTILGPWLSEKTREKEIRRRFTEAIQAKKEKEKRAPAKKLTRNVSTAKLPKKDELGKMTIGRSGGGFFDSFLKMRPLPEDPEFMDLNADEVALHLTLYESKLFRRITSSELLNKPWEIIKKDRTVTGNVAIAVMTDRFNKFSKWVATTVVTQTSPKVRSEAIKRWIMIGQTCYQYYNYNSVLAIVSGLNHTAVKRLTKSWEEVSDRYQQQLTNLENAISVLGHFKTYREDLDRAITEEIPAVPVIAVHIQDLFAINEVYPNYVDEETNPSPELVNFEKLFMCGRVIAKLLKLQQLPAFEGEIVDPERAEKVAYVIAKLPNTYQEQHLFETSHRQEPKPAADV